MTGKKTTVFENSGHNRMMEDSDRSMQSNRSNGSGGGAAAPLQVAAGELDVTHADWKVFTANVKARAKEEGAKEERKRFGKLGVKVDADLEED